jgi:hypothetical protein
MGFEYRFKLGRGDLENLARNPDGIADLDTLLRAGPGFLAKQGEDYSFSSDPTDKERWPSAVRVEQTGFLLCIYSRAQGSDGQQLLRYLMDSLLDRCGRLEVEEG